MKKIKKYVSLLLIAFILLSNSMGAVASAQQTEVDPAYDEAVHTAFITKKTAVWENKSDYLARLTLAVNATQRTEPLDIVICLDRSGSMSLHNIQGNGTHAAACPCLNQDHFYLYPVVNEGTEPEPEPDGFAADDPSAWETVYPNDDGTITVYNAELEKWVRLNTQNHEHLYYEFGTGEGKSPMDLAAYHFKMDGDNYVRISRWDTADIRKNDKAGIWVHGNETEGCYDRWAEVKATVEKFTAGVLNRHPENRVSLVPFSTRDSTMAETLNRITPLYKDWLIEERGDSGSWLRGMMVETNNELSGAYNAVVDWTQDPSAVTTVLDDLFPTCNTDYVYGLSQAYNLIAGRGDTDRKAVVVLLSDGTPYSTSTQYTTANTTYEVGSSIASFCNHDTHIFALANAIAAPIDTVITDVGNYGDLWTGTGRYQRHDIDSEYLEKDGTSGAVMGAPGLGAQIVTVSYMIDNAASATRLQKMASNSQGFIEIPPDASMLTAAALSERLLDAVVFPGGRSAVLKDEISQYFEVDKSQLNAWLGSRSGQVTIEETTEGNTLKQTVVWEIGDMYAHAEDLTIDIPLILKEAYRDVAKTTYYPTNADTNPDPDLFTPQNGEKGPDNGAKLYYTDFDDDSHYSTIGTPKLPVDPKFTPTPEPTPDPTPEPTPDPTPTPAPTPEGNLTLYLDVPLFPGLPTEEEIIEIPPEKVPLAGLPATGDDGQNIYILASIFILSSLALTLLLLTKKRIR